MVGARHAAQPITDKKTISVPGSPRDLKESVIDVGRLRLHTLATPGHTPGSMSFLIEDSPVLFTGDTLFPGGPGATSYEGGDFEQILESIENRMFRTLPSATLVMPGHGDDTTIGRERPSLDEWAARGW